MSSSRPTASTLEHTPADSKSQSKSNLNVNPPFKMNSTSNPASSDSGSENDMFLPSPPPPTSPSDRVNQIVARAKKVTTLSPAVAKYLATNSGAFTGMLDRRVALLRSRKPDFADFELNVFDVALLKLSDNGEKLESAAVVMFFCEEHLNIRVNAFADPQKTEAAVRRVVAAATKLAQVEKVVDAPLASSSTAAVGPSSSPPPAPSRQTTDIVERVWNTYTLALTEYRRLPPHDASLAPDDPRTVQLTKAAKFLRDTAENAIQYLGGKQVEPARLAELDATLQAAKADVVSLTGGKKRKFDEVEGQGVPSGPAAERGKGERMRGKNGGVEGQGAGERGDSRRKRGGWRMGRGGNNTGSGGSGGGGGGAARAAGPGGSVGTGAGGGGNQLSKRNAGDYWRPFGP